jgi:F-box interacting protein
MAMTGGSMDSLTDDILADIISRVPYKSTSCCKCVSTGWRDLITHPDHRAKMPQSLLGFFYETYDIARFPRKARYFINALAQGCPPLVDPSLSFLPKHESLDILDSCNGLLLCLLQVQEGSDADEIQYYVVCNPSTEKWVVVPTTEWSSRAQVYLAFDPAVSSHFHVCELVDSDTWHADGTGTIGDIAAVVIYSSKTGVWSHKADAWSGSSVDIPIGAKSVFFRGELHLCAYDNQLISIDVEENDWKSIHLPETVTVSFDIYLSHGQLHFAHIGLSALSIWVLEDPSTENWTLKRYISHLQLFETEYSAYAGDYSVISIHPEDNLIFIIAGHMQTLMSYGMDSMKQRIIRPLGSVSSNRVHCIPYVPLFLESLADGH